MNACAKRYGHFVGNGPPRCDLICSALWLRACLPLKYLLALKILGATRAKFVFDKEAF